MNELTLQTKVLTKDEMPVSARQIADNLLETYSGVESFVIVKSAMETLVQALELLKEKAIKSTVGKEAIIMGAKVTLKSTPRKYLYVGTEHLRLSNNLELAKQELKDHEKILQLSDKGWVNPETGETETSTMVSGEGTTITVTFHSKQQ